MGQTVVILGGSESEKEEGKEDLGKLLERTVVGDLVTINFIQQHDTGITFYHRQQT